MSKAPTLTVQIMQLTARLDAAEKQNAALVDYNEEQDRYMNEQFARLMERISKLEAAAHPVMVQRKTEQPIITYYVDRNGQRWEKTRIGNRASSRPAPLNA